MKYIIDTDPGIDDAIGIIMAYLYKLDIIGFTLVGGNVSLDNVERNIKTIQDFMGSDIKMYRGSEQYDLTQTAEFAHGKYGLGNAVYPISDRKIEDMSAEDFMIEMTKKYQNNLTIICFGSLTNVANAIKKDKDFANRLKHIVIMGTSYNPNEKNPYLEFNVFVNPRAAKVVFNTQFEDMRVISHELAVDTVISREYMESLRDSDKLLSNFVYQIAEKYMEFNKEKYNIDGISVPDPLTVASVIDENVVDFVKAKIDIVDEGEHKSESLVTLGEGNINFAVKVNFELFERMFKKVFN